MSGQIEAGRQNHISHLKWNKRWIILELNVSDIMSGNWNMDYFKFDVPMRLQSSQFFIIAEQKKVLNQTFFKDNDVYIW